MHLRNAYDMIPFEVFLKQNRMQFMINKKLLAMGLGVAMSVGASTSAMANGLTLTSAGAPTNILVYCNNIEALYPIPANGQLGPLPWFAIAAMFSDMAFQPINCVFKLDDAAHDAIGSATLTPTMSAGEITNVVRTSSYNVTITPGINAPYSDMTVALKAN